MREDFIYNDGGRAESGSVASVGDCAARAIAIATGRDYDLVFSELSDLQGESVRDGTYRNTTVEYLEQLGWTSESFTPTQSLPLEELPAGRVVVSTGKHLVAVIDRVIHDTYDCREDGKLAVSWYFLNHADERTPGALVASSATPETPVLDDSAIDRVKARIRQLLNVAANSASAEGEIRNAMRFAQNLMSKHQIDRCELGEGEAKIRYAMAKVFINGVNRTLWESMLAQFVTDLLCPSVGRFCSKQRLDSESRKRRTCYTFYGPEEDVEFCSAMFREMLASIAGTAKLKGYGGFARGPGAAYCQGFVQGLHDGFKEEVASVLETPEGRELTKVSNERALRISEEGRKWLETEHGIRLASLGGLGGVASRGSAYSKGLSDGKNTKVAAKHAPRRIAQAAS